MMKAHHSPHLLPPASGQRAICSADEMNQALRLQVLK